MSNGKIINHSELTDDLKMLIYKDAIIMYTEDGSFDILQNHSVCKNDSQILMSENMVVASQDANDKADPVRRVPKGGSYTDMKMGQLSTLTKVVYQTYMPQVIVNEWYYSQDETMLNYIKSEILTLGISKAASIAAKFFTKFKIVMAVEAIVAVSRGTIFLLKWMNKEQVKRASNSGKNGILVEYLTNIGQANSRVYSPWTTGTVPLKPYGGTAKWHSEDYKVMP